MQEQSLIQRFHLLGVGWFIPLACVLALGTAWSSAYGVESGLMAAVLLIASISITPLLLGKARKVRVLPPVVTWLLILGAVLASWPLKAVWYFDPATTTRPSQIASKDAPRSQISTDKSADDGREPLTLADLLESADGQETEKGESVESGDQKPQTKNSKTFQVQVDQ